MVLITMAPKAVERPKIPAAGRAPKGATVIAMAGAENGLDLALASLALQACTTP